jgi:hypothetical protein
LIVLASALALLGAGCRQDMHNQPKAKPQSKSAFFVDGRTGRLPVEGTVARGQLNADDHLYRGKIDGKFATTFPFPIDAAVVQRGFKVAASHHIERLRNETNGYWFDVITNGFGVMPPAGPQIPVKDRWAIVAYVRALQLSRHAALTDIPEAQREAVTSGRVLPGAQGEAKPAPPAEARH